MRRRRQDNEETSDHDEADGDDSNGSDEAEYIDQDDQTKLVVELEQGIFKQQVRCLSETVNLPVCNVRTVRVCSYFSKQSSFRFSKISNECKRPFEFSVTLLQLFHSCSLSWMTLLTLHLVFLVVLCAIFTVLFA
jgi:hypothetical protein